jgi:hypothetical protein
MQTSSSSSQAKSTNLMTTEVTHQITLPSTIHEQQPSLAAGSRQENSPIDHQPLNLGTLTSFTANQPLPSPADFKDKLIKQPNTWANCSLETLYDIFVQMCSSLPSEKVNKSIYRNQLWETTEVETISLALPDVLIEGAGEKEEILQENFFDNMHMLKKLELAVGSPEITMHFPPVPKALAQTEGHTALHVKLQEIKQACIKMLQDEYLIIARLCLAETQQEKMVLLLDYVLSEVWSSKLIRCVALLPDGSVEKEDACTKIFFEWLDHYTYAVAAFYHLANRMQALSTAKDKDALALARLMQSYLDATIKIVESRNDFFKKDTLRLRTKHTKVQTQLSTLPQEKKSAAKDTLANFKPERFDKMLEYLQPIRDSLVTHIEQDLLPAFLQKEFKFELSAPARKKGKERKPSLSPKKYKHQPFAVKQPQAAKAKQSKMHKINTSQPENASLIGEKKVFVLPQKNMPAPVIAEQQPVKEAEDEVKVSVLQPEKSLSTDEVKPLIAEESVIPSSKKQHTASASPIKSELLPPVASIAPYAPLLPVSAIVSHREPMPTALTRNVKLTNLNKDHWETYEQIFSDRWSETRHLTLSAVEKLVTRLGGKMKGAKGSRTQLFFNDKSVATIEHRHGGDKAGALYKVSLALLQRGLGIAGFAPPGWEDKLSRTRDLIVNFREYVAKRKQGS